MYSGKAIVGGYGIVRIHPEEFERKRGFVDSCYVILYEEEVNHAFQDGEWELNENEFPSYEEAEEWRLQNTR